MKMASGIVLGDHRASAPDPHACADGSRAIRFRAGRKSRAILAAAAFFAAGLVANPLLAQEAYVLQAEGGATPSNVAGDGATSSGSTSDQHIEGFVYGHQPGAPVGANVARSFVFGDDNIVTQVQEGRDNRSDVLLFNSNKNYVGVWQIGDGLRSTVGLVNKQNTAVIVPQRPGSEPSNVWVFGLRNGGTVIAR